MDNIDNEELTGEQLRRLGETILKITDSYEERQKAFDYLKTAGFKYKDADALYLFCAHVVSGEAKWNVDNPYSAALEIIRELAFKGHVEARVFLNSRCKDAYLEYIKNCGETKEVKGPLVDFEGKKIKIKRKGILTPIDAELKYVDGKNILVLTTDISIIASELPVSYKVEQAIVAGICEWEGEYEVFGGQKLYVKINLTSGNKSFDCVYICLMDKGNLDAMTSFAKKANSLLNNEATKESLKIIESRRSFVLGRIRKWTSKSKKFICLFSKDDSFSDYDEIKHVVKHEFGHALGLGDLYYSPSDKLEGVEKGTYKDIDPYYIQDKTYFSVMSDHHGPITNNDIEMVVLAFRKNKAQLYQKQYGNDKISEALGKGN